MKMYELGGTYEIVQGRCEDDVTTTVCGGEGASELATTGVRLPAGVCEHGSVRSIDRLSNSRFFRNVLHCCVSSELGTETAGPS
jgi:hypothetical protein